MKLQEIEKKIEAELSNKRYRHTIGVSYVAAALAMKYDVDIEQARIAGLLHDCAKWMDPSQMKQYCIDHAIPVSSYEKDNPGLLHGKIGAAIAKNNYDIEDLQVLQAITYHTTGRPNMSTLEKIIYIADYIEPNRQSLNRIDCIRKIAFEDMDYAIYYISEDTLEFLASTNKAIDPATKETYEFYKENYTCQKKSNN